MDLIRFGCKSDGKLVRCFRCPARCVCGGGIDRVGQSPCREFWSNLLEYLIDSSREDTNND